MDWSLWVFPLGRWKKQVKLLVKLLFAGPVAYGAFNVLLLETVENGHAPRPITVVAGSKLHSLTAFRGFLCVVALVGNLPYLC